MREILFRGKRMTDGKWVYGDYHKYTCTTSSITPTPTHYIMGTDIRFKAQILVDPDTVGQYTGLTDKNGVKIFEGDIVRERLKGLEEAFHCVCLDYGRVFWYQKTARFLRTAAIFSDDCQEMTEYHEYEVVGNIYDNPGFLEEVPKWTPPPA